LNRVTGSSTQHKGVTPDVGLPSAFDPEQYGESSNPSALPWDVIKPVSFQKVNEINGQVISGLNKAYLERAKFDVSLKNYISDTDDLRSKLSQSKISLNESKRKFEMEEIEKKKASEKLDTKLTGKEGLPVDELINLKDEYLREGLLILGDLVVKRFG